MVNYLPFSLASACACGCACGCPSASASASGCTCGFLFRNAAVNRVQQNVCRRVFLAVAQRFGDDILSVVAVIVHCCGAQHEAYFSGVDAVLHGVLVVDVPGEHHSGVERGVRAVHDGGDAARHGDEPLIYFGDALCLVLRHGDADELEFLSIFLFLFVAAFHFLSRQPLTDEKQRQKPAEMPLAGAATRALLLLHVSVSYSDTKESFVLPCSA